MSRKNKTKVSFPSIEQIEKERKRLSRVSSYKKALRSTIGTLVVVAAIAVLVATLMLPVLRIYGTSMSPTLNDGDIVVSVKGASFVRGETIAFYYNNKILVKRVIAMPGEWVNMDEDGYVYIDSKRLDEPYLVERAIGECDIELPYQVPDGRLFVMGDHRSVSVDSRSSTIGCISEEQIVGRLVFKVWPIQNFGKF
ncbi:MAG: signal peptidase I [Ruminococcus sp.]|nr:signal peptidase I [Ruminococcus sp.]